MRTKTISSGSAPAPGDIRHYGDGVTIKLRQSARDRDDWCSLLCAFSVAIARGASIVWEG